jgi:hypothetical protein
MLTREPGWDRFRMISRRIGASAGGIRARRRRPLRARITRPPPPKLPGEVGDADGSRLANGIDLAPAGAPSPRPPPPLTRERGRIRLRSGNSALRSAGPLPRPLPAQTTRGEGRIRVRQGRHPAAPRGPSPGSSPRHPPPRSLRGRVGEGGAADCTAPCCTARTCGYSPRRRTLRFPSGEFIRSWGGSGRGAPAPRATSSGANRPSRHVFRSEPHLATDLPVNACLRNRTCGRGWRFPGLRNRKVS